MVWTGLLGCTESFVWSTGCRTEMWSLKHVVSEHCQHPQGHFKYYVTTSEICPSDLLVTLRTDKGRRTSQPQINCIVRVFFGCLGSLLISSWIFSWGVCAWLLAVFWARLVECMNVRSMYACMHACVDDCLYWRNYRTWIFHKCRQIGKKQYHMCIYTYIYIYVICILFERKKMR